MEIDIEHIVDRLEQMADEINLGHFRPYELPYKSLVKDKQLLYAVASIVKSFGALSK